MASVAVACGRWLRRSRRHNPAHMSLHARAVEHLQRFGALARRSSGEPWLTRERSP